MNKANYIVFDFETDGVDPKVCQPLQIAATVLNPRNLETYEQGVFQSYMRPDFETLDVQALEINKISQEQLEQAPSAKNVWKSFAKFVERYNVIDGKRVLKPIPVGYNIKNFDLQIVQRLNDAYYKKDIMNRFSIDVLDIVFMWFENNVDLPNLKLDSVRQLLGYPSDGAHNAIVDVDQTADIFRNFIKVHRNFYEFLDWKSLKV